MSSIFNQYCRQTPRPLSVYHYSSIALWSDFFEFDCRALGEHYAVFAKQGKGMFLYLPPLGPSASASVITQCLDIMGPNPVARIENIDPSQAKLYESMGLRLFLKSYEYIYRKEDISMLSGNAYKSQRHDRNVCQQRYRPQMRSFATQDQEACLNLFKRWSKHRRQNHEDIIYQQMLDDNTLVHKRMFEQADSLGMIVRVATVDDQIVGYTAGYELNENTFCVYAEITDPDISGLSAWIFSRFCQEEALKPYQRINAMDDFGLPQLGLAKERYHPVEKQAVYNATR